MLLTISRIASLVCVLASLLSCGGGEDLPETGSKPDQQHILSATSDPVMDVQLPFVEGAAYRCTQNSNDTPTHSGSSTFYDLDFGMPKGTVVVAAAEGVVRRGSHPNGFGTYARVEHSNGYWTMYAHLSGFIATDGQRVVAGQPIAYSGNTGDASTGPHLHFGVHQGAGVGVSTPMRVRAYNRSASTDAWLVTGSKSVTQFKCDTSASARDGHIYEVSYFGPVFNDYRCVALSGTSGVLCWNRNPVECVDGENHVRFFKNNEGATVSESVNRHTWCAAGTGQQTSVVAFLDGGYGVGGYGPGGSTDPTEPPTPGLPDFVTDSMKAYDLAGNERYSFSQGETMRVHHVTCNVGDADWAGDRDDMYVMLLLSRGYKEDAHSEWREAGREQIQKGNIDAGTCKSEYFTVNLANVNNGSPIAPGIYNFVGWPDRKYLEDNGDGEVPEKHKSNNRSTELVFEVTLDPSVPRPDFVISNAYLVGTVQPVPAGQPMGGRMAVRNIGLAAPWGGIRSSYSVCDADGITNCAWKADDGSDAAELTPGRDQWEETLSRFAAPSVPGNYALRVCANYLETELESDTSNNCRVVPFTVVSALPDLTITAIGTAGAKVSIKKDSTVETALYAKNVGNVPVGGFEFICYYRVNGGAWVHYATQLMGGLNPGEERRGVCKNLKFNQRGTWEILGLVDSRAQYTEANKANNWVKSSYPITVY